MLATPLKMQAYTRDQYGDRTVSSLESIVDDPIQLLKQSRLDAGNPVQTQLDILSASRYPQAFIQDDESDHIAVKRKKPDTAAPQQLYGGIFQKSESNDTTHDSSSAEQDSAPPRPRKVRKTKKTKKDDEDAANDESKRQRGRPRLDTQDETAADRRRTQIRLAQRAYRHRKETTITGLKQRVLDLQSTIEQMNNTFLDLHDNLIDAGITTSHVGLARQLKKATEEFVNLAKITELENDEENTKIAELTGTANGSHPNRFETEAQRDSGGTGKESTPQESLSDDADVEELPLIENGFPYMDNNSWSNMNTDIMQFRVDVPQTQFAMDALSDKARNAAATLFPSSTIEYPLSSPSGKNGSYTYSFQETTFSRRLHRRCLENAWRDLTNPSIDPAVLNRSFRFTFCFSNRKRMLHRFKDMLQRKAGEALENWNVPFFHIGGAGTHFPRRDKDGKPMYPPNMLSPEKALVSQDMGPHQWIGNGAETPRADLKDTQAMLEAIGFGGEWFDSHDVQEYLKAKGIYLDGTSSFVEIDPSVVLPRIPARSQTKSSTSSSTSPSENPLRTPSPMMPTLQEQRDIAMASDLFTEQEMNELYPSIFTSVAAGANYEFDEKDSSIFPPRQQEQLSVEQVYNQQIWPWNNNSSYFANESTIPSNAMGELFPQLSASAPRSPGYTPSFGDLLGRQAGPVTLDVERFLEKMVEGAACLGRAPGFRKEMVENALALSVAESF